MASVKNSIAVVDDRPYFEKAVRYGLEQGILTPENITRMEADGPKGIVQIADHFGTAYLRTDLESAVARMANLISLYLEDFSNGDLRAAAISLRDNTLLSHSRGGSEMLKRLHAMPGDTSLHLRKVEPAAQKIFVNERSFAFPLSVASYRAQVEQCQANQMRIDFARWLARQLGAQQDEYEDYSAEEVIRSAMLLLYVGAKTLELPSKSEFIKKKTSSPTTNWSPRNGCASPRAKPMIPPCWPPSSSTWRPAIRPRHRPCSRTPRASLPPSAPRVSTTRRCLLSSKSTPPSSNAKT